MNRRQQNHKEYTIITIGQRKCTLTSMVGLFIMIVNFKLYLILIFVYRYMPTDLYGIPNSPIVGIKYPETRVTGDC